MKPVAKFLATGFIAIMQLVLCTLFHTSIYYILVILFLRLRTRAA
jgi:hypothetical protein